MLLLSFDQENSFIWIKLLWKRIFFYLRRSVFRDLDFLFLKEVFCWLYFWYSNDFSFQFFSPNHQLNLKIDFEMKNYKSFKNWHKTKFSIVYICSSVTLHRKNPYKIRIKWEIYGFPFLTTNLQKFWLPFFFSYIKNTQ